MKFILLATTLLMRGSAAQQVVNEAAADDQVVSAALKNILPSPIEYTVHNDVAILYNTPLAFDEFWSQLR